MRADRINVRAGKIDRIRNRFARPRVLVVLSAFSSQADSLSLSQFLKGFSPMKQTCHSARDLRGLLVAICALLLVTTTLGALAAHAEKVVASQTPAASPSPSPDRKSTRLNSSHVEISYAVFCL